MFRIFFIGRVRSYTIFTADTGLNGVRNTEESTGIGKLHIGESFGLTIDNLLYEKGCS